MIKKVAIGSGVAVLVMLFLFGRSAYSYLSTTVSRVHDSVKSVVPLDFELNRARKETSRITPEVRKNMHVIASEEVKVEQLEKRIKALEEKLQQDQKNILRLKSDLESGAVKFVYLGISYSETEVKRDLESRFDEYTTDEETLKSMVKLLQARNNSLHSAKDRLASMQSAQQKLRVEIENLEARKALLSLHKRSTEDSFEDSQLSRTRELVDAINSRILTDEKMLAAESRSMDRIPVERAEEEVNLLDRITHHFDDASKVSEEVADEDSPEVDDLVKK